MALNVGAVDYFECSALTREGLNEAFQKTCLATKKKKIRI